MTIVQQSTFIIIREDRAEDPKTIISDGLRIGRVSESDVWLNHPKVSRLHAGINEIGGYFFLINLSGSSATTLNGRIIPFNEAEALSTGDELQIGPYFLQVENIDRSSETLSIRVVLQPALNVGERDLPLKSEAYQKQWRAGRITGSLITTGALARPGDSQAANQETESSSIANSLKLFWGKRTREKAGRQSPLHPRTPPRLGKVRFNWTPTRDLVRPWPFAIFVWAAVIVGSLATLAVFAHKNAFAPEPISDPHTRKSFAVTPVIAKQPNGGSCTACHALGISVANKEKMNSNCAGCHHTEAFVATVIPAHRQAGLTCTTCHAEHRGRDFRPMSAALESCAKCHNDQNKNLYNGKSVHTAHGGTYGYPVKDRIWIWTGLDAEELAEKPELAAFLRKNRVDASQTQEWRNAQFHGIHLNHLRVLKGVDGILDDDGVSKVLSCSSCHKTGYMGANIDREYPRTTCGQCHNVQVFNEPSSSARRDQTPSCTSCHIQHVKDVHWAAAFRDPVQQQPASDNKRQEQH